LVKCFLAGDVTYEHQWPSIPRVRQFVIFVIVMSRLLLAMDIIQPALARSGVFWNWLWGVLSAALAALLWRTLGKPWHSRILGMGMTGNAMFARPASLQSPRPTQATAAPFRPAPLRGPVPPLVNPKPNGASIHVIRLTPVLPIVMPGQKPACQSAMRIALLHVPDAIGMPCCHAPCLHRGSATCDERLVIPQPQTGRTSLEGFPKHPAHGLLRV
jgi:hypothetical protein